MHYPSVSLIIPCYNESARVTYLFDGLKEFEQVWKGDYEVILVDDGSTDGTDLFIEQHPAFFALAATKKVSLLRQQNTGKGGALKLGVQHAMKAFVLTLDADMASSPAELLRWLEIKRTFAADEILIASRELPASVVQDSFKRKLIGHIFNFIIRITVHLKIKDTQCGFKLYPEPIAKKIFAELKTLGWAHDVELLLRSQEAGCTIREMPVSWNAIEGSKIQVLRDGWRMFWEVIKISKQAR